MHLKGPRRFVDNMDKAALEVYVDALPEADEGHASYEKPVALRNAPERTLLITPIPKVVVQLPKVAKRRKR